MKWFCNDCGNDLDKEEGVWALWGRDSTWYTLCSKCEELRRETEPHTCGNCRFCGIYPTTCRRISKGLNFRGIFKEFLWIHVELDFSCGFWEYMPRYSWDDVNPFIFAGYSGNDWVNDAWIAFCKPGSSETRVSPDQYIVKSAARMAKWLNSLWNERRVK